MKNFRIISLLTLLVLGLWFYLKKGKKLSVSTEKVLERAVPAHIKSLDPAQGTDSYGAQEIAKVYEGLLGYHYLKRPAELVPNLAEAMPTVSDDGLVYTFKIKKGVRYHDDPCFPEGQGRELIAEDFVYSFKRLADVKLQSPHFSSIAGKIQGLDAWRRKYTDAPTTYYEEELAGLKALDKYTLQLKLVHPFPQLLYELASPWFSVVPKEAVQYYGAEFLNRPVGTGPFVLKEYNPHVPKLTYYKNPTFREKYFPKEASEEYKHMLVYAGKKLPFVDKVVSHIITEGQSRWLKFQKGELDFMAIPGDVLTVAIDPNGAAAPTLQEKGVQLQYGPDIAVFYIAFNHTHALFKSNLKLRQAMSLAYDRQELNQLFFNGKALIAQSIIPPGAGGYQAAYQNPYSMYDLEKAKQLLAEAGYPGGKGMPELVLDVANSNRNRQIGEHFQKSMAKIGVRVKVMMNPWPQLLEKVRKKDTMLHIMGYTNYPDGLPFLRTLYGPAAPGKNSSNFNDAEYNALYEQAYSISDAPARIRLYEKMSQLAAEKAPLIYMVCPATYALNHSWLKNYTLAQDFIVGEEQYLDIDLEQRKAMRAKF